MKEKIDAIKNEIRNLRFYQSEIKRIKERIEQIEYDEANVKGVLYSKQPGSTNPLEANLRRLDQIEKKEKMEEEILEFCVLINRILRWLNAMPREDRLIVMDVLVDRKPYAQVCEEKGISSTGTLFRMVNSIIEEATKKG